MKAAIITLLCILLCAVGVAVVILFNQDYFQETEMRLYATTKAAIESGNRWLPDFLPGSATNIREKHNLDYNRGIVAFEFALSDFQRFSGLLQKVPRGEFQDIRPTWVYREEPWFPKVILTGKLERLQKEGFEIYEIGRQLPDRIINGKIQKWFLAVNTNQGIAYVWY